MKSKKIQILENILRSMAKAVLARQNAKIVGITGSVGKTSTKTAVFTVLSKKFNVRVNQKNYNNEIGIPLTIIGADTGGKNIFKWILVFLKWLFALVDPRYPEILILELGVDRPQDMQYFMSFIKPNVGIMTNISSSHVEYFKTLDNIAKEKRILIESLNENGFALLNADDEKIALMGQNTKAQVITFGKKLNAQINASNIVYNYDGDNPDGISFKLNYDGKNIPVRLRNILAPHQIYAATAAIGTGIIFKMNLIEIASALEELQSPTGRMNLLEGINGSYLIDDTYNASPVSTVAALDVLHELKSKRKIAILGDMLELGEESDRGHREVGRKILQSKVDIFVAVGKRMEIAVEELIAGGFSSANILKFSDPDFAAEKLPEIIEQGDFILIKGSQGMRMEKIAESLLCDKSLAEKLLCRQGNEWKSKPFLAP